MYSIHEDYQHKENRDAAAQAYTAQGYKVRRRSQQAQLMHPMYIKDWKGELDTGFGNTQYQTYFAVVYSLEASPA